MFSFIFHYSSSVHVIDCKVFYQVPTIQGLSSNKRLSRSVELTAKREGNYNVKGHKISQSHNLKYDLVM